MNAPGAVAAGPTATPTFHLHPLRRCNLACRHCYSSSSLQATDALTRREALDAIRQASVWGYTRLAVSGGEPLLYPWLGECMALAAELGMSTALVTNGLLLSRPGIMRILQRVDAVSVSIDGLGAAHDAIRGRAGAFGGAIAGLAALADAGIRFGIVCGVASVNLDDIEEVAATALQAGAGALQFHPIAQAGRARALMPDASLSADDSMLLYVAAALLAQQHAGRLHVHTDLIHQRHVLHNPSLIYARDLEQHWRELPPARLLGVLVVEPDGTVNPVSFGFAPAFGLGNIRAAPLGQLWRHWLDAGYGRLLGLGATLLSQLAHGAVPRVLNPSDLLCAASHRAAAPDLAGGAAAAPESPDTFSIPAQPAIAVH